MANAEHLARLRKGPDDWNQWRAQHPNDRVDLSLTVFEPVDTFGLDRFNLSGVDLSNSRLSGAHLSGVNLRQADLREAVLTRATLSHAILRRANLSGANLKKADASGVNLGEANLDSANLSWATFAGAQLGQAKLFKANLSNANLGSANLVRADLRYANLTGAQLEGASLHSANLRSANLQRANLSGADLRAADLDNADLNGAKMDRATLFRTGLTQADLSGADLTRADLRAATLLQTKLNKSILNYAMLWETQRTGWEIKGVVCESVYWDKDAEISTSYASGEFEKLYSEQTCIELFYEGGVSKFELDTLPALLHHLATLHKGANIRLKSIEETGGGAKILISVADADTETVEKIRADALQVHGAQLVLRDNEILRLETEKKYLESFVSERLIKAMLTATTQQNVFNAPVYGVALSSGNSSAVVNQTVNDTAGLLALLDKIIERRRDLDLPQADATRLEAEAQSARAELEKPQPSPSILSRSLKFVQEMAGEAVKKAAGKIGEQAVSADWHSLLGQLDEFVRHLK
jgi:uncharacterized protein YjbI with pentapeptide repeats